VNLFAYCGNNPIERTDILGYAWSWAAGLVGAVVNVVTTYIAAKATGQDYTWKDAGVAAVTGLFNTMSPIASGAFSGIYAYLSARVNGASIKDSLITGIVSGVCTTASMGNIANHLAPKELSLFGNVVMDLTYGTGANLISASVNRLVMDGAKTRTDMGIQNKTVQNSLVISRTRILDKRGISVAHM